MNKELMFSSKHDGWETPKDLFAELDREFHFGTDVCAAWENALCTFFYTKALDGLAQDWSGNCFMNPPYGKEIGKWIEKAYWETAQGKASLVVGLLPARTDTKWFHEFIYEPSRREYLDVSVEIRFLKGRLKFSNAKNPAPFPSMIVIWRSYGR